MRKIQKPLSIRLGEFCGRMFAWAGFWLWLPWGIAKNTVRVLQNRRRINRDCQRTRCDEDGIIVDARGRFIPIALREAYAWTCHVCAEENWMSIPRVHPTNEQAVTMARIEGVIYEWQGIESVPEHIVTREIGLVSRIVCCGSCGAKFVVECSCGQCSHDDEELE
jgi:hypothetical protein